MVRQVMRLAGVWFLVMAAGLGLVACSGPGNAGNDGNNTAKLGVNIGDQARNFALETLEGDKSSLSDYLGSVVVVNFWATWCPPCREEIPDIEASYQAHKGEGLVVLGLSVDEPRETVVPFVAQFQMTYPVLLDVGGKVMKSYRVPGLPASVILDRDGVIQVRHIGYLSGAQLEEYLDELLP